MKTLSIPERIEYIKSEIGIEEDAEFGRLCGMSKSVVNQLKAGKMKSFAARYAYKLEESTGFCAKWIQLGEGIERQDFYINQAVKIMQEMPLTRRKDVLNIINSLIEAGNNGKTTL